MSALTVFAEDQPQTGQRYLDFVAIKAQLASIDVQFERWSASNPLPEHAQADDIMVAYSDSISRLKQQYGFQAVDIVSLTPEHPDKAELRQKFLAEHSHDDFEVRFFVEGSGLFYLHINGLVYALLCEQGDLISVPAHVYHWFDMGKKPFFKAIRLFTAAEGWVAQFTGSEIAKSFPSYDDYIAGLA
ncbi:MAG: cupin [Methylococcaceae bacterium]|jgi:1,2-dihydroxy-3-keto-5-methylthiopentene dioxygenase